MSRSASQPALIELFGIPFDAQSSFLRGPALAPAEIRAALHDGSGNWFAECGRDLAEPGLWVDGGDLPQTDTWAEISAAIRERASALLHAGRKFLAWGGDHSVSYPLIAAVAQRHKDLCIVHLDAHPDLYDSFEGNRYSHACPFARVLEELPSVRLIQIGIRTATAHQRDQAARFGVETFPASNWRLELLPKIVPPVYLSLDMDVLDPALAPGVSHREPGGLSTRDVLQVIHALRGKLIAADLVEFNPTRDPQGITASVAVKFTKELLASLGM